MEWGSGGREGRREGGGWGWSEGQGVGREGGAYLAKPMKSSWLVFMSARGGVGGQGVGREVGGGGVGGQGVGREGGGWGWSEGQGVGREGGAYLAKPMKSSWLVFM